MQEILEVIDSYGIDTRSIGADYQRSYGYR